MERDTVRRIISNHKAIPFVKQIIEGATPELSFSKLDKVYIVYSGSQEEAVKSKDYIEFESEKTAQEFISDYKKYFDKIPMEEMGQKEFEDQRKATKWTYSGTVERVG